MGTAHAARVTDILRSLGASGVEVLYSSDLVPPALEAPSSNVTDPMQRANDALHANHLSLRKLASQRYVVVREVTATATAEADTNPSGSSHQLDEIEVFGSRYAITQSGAVSGLTRNDIETAPGAAQDVMRAVRNVPGMATNLSSRPSVRGAFVDGVLVRFDGIPLTDPFHFKNFQSIMSAFDPAAIEQVDVYTGGFPVKYGTRSAGVIDLAPRSVASGSDTLVGLSRLSYDFSTVGHADRWPIDWLVTMRHSVHDIALKPINGDVGEPRFIDALGRFRVQASDTWGWTLGWLLLDDRVRLTTDPSTERADAHDRDLYTWLAADWAPTGDIQSRTSVSVTTSKRERRGAVNLTGVAGGTLYDQRNLNSVDARSEWTYSRSASVSYNFGIEATHESANLAFDRQEQFFTGVANSFARDLDTSLAGDAVLHSQSQALFASARKRWERFEAEIGGRFDRQDYRDFGARAQFSPRLNLRMDLSPATQLYGSWGRFTQAQRISEWRLEASQTAPDPASVATHIIAGASHESEGGTRVHAEIYRNTWSSVPPYFDNALDALSLLPDLKPDRVLISPTTAETSGLELSARRGFSHGFQVSAAYSLSRTVDEFRSLEIPRSWDQTHAGNVDVSWHSTSTSASMLFNWHSGWPRTPATVMHNGLGQPVGIVLGDRNSARWGSYLTVDLRLAQVIPLPVGRITLWSDITNLTNRRNTCCTVLGPDDGMKGAPSLGVDSWLSRTVNLGFTWEFRTAGSAQSDRRRF